MEVKIKDGNSGGVAKVDSNNRLHVRAITSAELENAVHEGEAFNLSTGAITLTSGNKSAVAYMKYNGNDPLIIKEILVIIDASTGGAGDGIITIKKNPTTGTWSYIQRC